MRSASATEVPPNFITTVSEPAGGMVGNDSFPPVRPEPGRRRLAILLIAALALAAGAAGVVVGAGGDDDEETAASVPSPGRGAPRSASPSSRGSSRRPRAPRGADRGAAFPPSVAAVARRMSVERRVAQVFLFGFRGTDATAEIFGRLRRLDLGGITLEAPNYVSADQLALLAGEAAVVARQSRHIRRWCWRARRAAS